MMLRTNAPKYNCTAISHLKSQSLNDESDGSALQEAGEQDDDEGDRLEERLVRTLIALAHGVSHRPSQPAVADHEHFAASQLKNKKFDNVG